MFCVLIGSSFSVRRSILVLYLVQPYNVIYHISISFDTCTQSTSRVPSLYDSKSVPLIPEIFLSSALDSSSMSWKLGIVLRFKVFLPFPMDVLMLLELKWKSQTSALLKLNLPAPSFIFCSLLYLKMDIIDVQVHGLQDFLLCELKRKWFLLWVSFS